MRYEMTTATIVHLTGYPSEQNWNVSVNQLLNGARSPEPTPSCFAVNCCNQVMSVFFDPAKVYNSSNSVTSEVAGMGGSRGDIPVSPAAN